MTSFAIQSTCRQFNYDCLNNSLFSYLLNAICRWSPIYEHQFIEVFFLCINTEKCILSRRQRNWNRSSNLKGSGILGKQSFITSKNLLFRNIIVSPIRLYKPAKRSFELYPKLFQLWKFMEQTRSTSNPAAPTLRTRRGIWSNRTSSSNNQLF